MKKAFALCIFLFMSCAVMAQVISNLGVLESLKPGESTLEDVQKVLGYAEHTDQNADGRFVHMYSFAVPSPTQFGRLHRGKVAILYGPDGLFIRHRIYEQKQ